MTSAQPEHEWTATWLRAFLTEKKVLTPKVRFSLSDHALMWLTIDIFAWTQARHAPLPPPPPPGTATKGAVESVRNGLERWREEETIQLASWRGHRDTPDDPYVRTNMDRVSETINRITVALSVLDELKLPARKPRNAWHRFAAPLAFQFIRQVKECGHSLKLAEKGPAAKFVHAVIPLISGEQPSLGTVATFLKSRAPEILRV